MLVSPNVTARAAILLGVFLGFAGPGLAATAPLTIRAVVRWPATVTLPTSASSQELQTPDAIVDGHGKPLALSIQFPAAIATAGTRFVTVLADGGPLASAGPEVAPAATH
jgi:hypothetical protein